MAYKLLKILFFEAKDDISLAYSFEIEITAKLIRLDIATHCLIL
jgi:hypothetical protein